MNEGDCDGIPMDFDIGEDPIHPDYEEIDDAPDTIPNSMGEMSYEE